MNNNISRKDLVFYAMISMPLAFSGIPLYIHAPDFYATQFGVPLASLGFVLFFLRFIDAIQDPLIGYFSDKHAKHRLVIMFCFAMLLVICFALLFKPLINSYILWFFIFTFISTTSFSILTINLNTLGGIWSKDRHKKTTIAGFREAFGLAGLILAVILPSIFETYTSKIKAFEYISYILFFIMLISFIFFGNWQKKHNYLNNYTITKSFTFKFFFILPLFIRKFFMIYAISMLSSSIPAVLVLFFIRDRLNLQEYTGLFLLSYFISAIFGIVLWKFVSNKYGKYNAWLIAMILAIFSFVWASFLGSGYFFSYLFICLATGISFGADLVLPASILADHIKAYKKENEASYYYSILAFLAKFVLALASFFSLSFLDVFNFKPNATSNTQNALLVLSINYALIPCCIKMLSAYFLWRLKNNENIYNNNRSYNYV